MNTKITAVYLRIHSEDKQAKDDQIDEMNKYCSINNLEAAYYVDQGLEADYKKQPQFKKLHNDVLKGRISKIVLRRLETVSRKALDGMIILDSWLKKDTSIIILNEPLLLDGENRQFTRHLLQIFSRWEEKIRKTHSLNGIARAKKKAPEKYSGRKMGAYSVDSDKILELRAKRLSIVKVSEIMNVGRTTVQNHIDRKAVIDVNSALETISEKSDSIGSFNLTFDFHDGLKAIYKVNGSKDIKIPKKIIGILMKASKKWFPRYHDLNKIFYQNLMNRIALLWYEHQFSKWLDDKELDHKSSLELIDQAERDVIDEDKHREIDQPIKSEDRVNALESARDIMSAFRLMAKQNNLDGSFEFNFDFDTGLTGVYKVEGKEDVKIWNTSLRGMIKASKKWSSEEYDIDIINYEKLMNNIAYICYQKQFSSESDKNEFDQINITKMITDSEEQVGNQSELEQDDKLNS